MELLNKDVIIISGGARGVDRTAVDTAKKRGMTCIEYPAQWYMYGKRAAAIRNKKIADDSELMVAFWDVSSGN